MPFVQGTWASSSSDVASPALTGVGANNSLILKISSITNAVRTFTVVDSVDGALTPVVESNPNRGVAIYVLHNATAGAHTVTVTASGTTTFRVTLTERSGLDTGASPVTDSLDDGSALTDHYGSTSGITTSGSADIEVIGVLSSATGVGALSPTGSYTEHQISGGGTTDTGVQYFAMRWDGAGAVTNERGYWTTAGAQRGLTAIAAFPLAGGGGGATSHVTGGWFGR